MTPSWELAAELEELHHEVESLVPGIDIDWAMRVALLGRIDGLRKLAVEAAKTTYVPSRWT
jgi:hypothetical protein